MKKMWMFTCISISAALLLSASLGSAITLDDVAKAVTPEAKPAAASAWLTNMEIAMQQAKKENKVILIDFTGSDWCVWCKRLDAEVFETPAFKAEAAKSYVLVKLDFPKTTPQMDAVKEYNKKWMEKFGVRGFPTMILADANGERLAQTGYQQGGGEKYVAHLKEICSQATACRDQLKKAAALKGAEKAQALDKALADLDDDQVITLYPAEVDMIISLDADNKLGLKNKYSIKKALTEIQAMMRPDTLEAAKAKITQVMKDLKPEGEDAQKLLFLQANVDMYSRDRDAAKKSFEAALAAAPKSEVAPKIQQILAQYFSPFASRLSEIGEMAKDPSNQEDIKKALAEIAKTEKEMKLDAEQRQQLLGMKAEICMKTGDKEEARKAFEAAVKAAPESESAAQIKQILELYFTPVAERLIAINEMAKDPGNQEGVKNALVEIDKTEKEMKMNGEQRQQLLALKGEILTKKGDKKEAKAAFEAALKAAPESRAAPRIKYTLDSM